MEETAQGERHKRGFDTWNEAVATARDRAHQRRLVNGPTLPGREGTNDNDD